MAKLSTNLTEVFKCKKHNFSSITQSECPICELEFQSLKKLDQRGIRV